MKIKTSELTGATLDWAVATCEGATDFMHDGISMHFELHGLTKVLATGWAPSMSYHPSTNWSQGGPIIEREICEIIKGGEPTCWEARAGFDGEPGHAVATGPTPLIAAMRCLVASKLGDTVEIPNGLC